MSKECYISPCDHGESYGNSDLDRSGNQFQCCAMFDLNDVEDICKKFRELSMNERATFLENCSRRFPSAKKGKTFEVDYALPWKGNHYSICAQFLCHVLQIPNHYLKWHQERVWNGQQEQTEFLHQTIFSPRCPFSSRSALKEDDFVSKLPKVFGELDNIHLEHLKNLELPRTDMLDRQQEEFLKAAKDSTQRIANRNLPKLDLSKIHYPKLKKLDEMEESDEDDEVGLWSFFLGGSAPSSKKAPPPPPRSETPSEMEIELDENDIGPYYEFVNTIESIASRLDGIGSKLIRKKKFYGGGDDMDFDIDGEHAQEDEDKSSGSEDFLAEVERSNEFVENLVSGMQFDNSVKLLDEIQKTFVACAPLASLDLDYMEAKLQEKILDEEKTLDGVLSAVNEKVDRDKNIFESFLLEFRKKQEKSNIKQRDYTKDVSSLLDGILSKQHNDDDIDNYSKLQLQLLVTAMREKVRNMTEFAERLFKCEDPDAEVIQILLKNPRVEPVLEHLRCLAYGKTYISNDDNHTTDEVDSLKTKKLRLENTVKDLRIKNAEQKDLMKQLKVKCSKLEKEMGGEEFQGLPSNSSSRKEPTSIPQQDVNKIMEQLKSNTDENEILKLKNAQLRATINTLQTPCSDSPPHVPESRPGTNSEKKCNTEEHKRLIETIENLKEQLQILKDTIASSSNSDTKFNELKKNKNNVSDIKKKEQNHEFKTNTQKSKIENESKSTSLDFQKLRTEFTVQAKELEDCKKELKKLKEKGSSTLKLPKTPGTPGERRKTIRRQRLVEVPTVSSIEDTSSDESKQNKLIDKLKKRIRDLEKKLKPQFELDENDERSLTELKSKIAKMNKEVASKRSTIVQQTKEIKWWKQRWQKRFGNDSTQDFNHTNNARSERQASQELEGNRLMGQASRMKETIAHVAQLASSLHDNNPLHDQNHPEVLLENENENVFGTEAKIFQKLLSQHSKMLSTISSKVRHKLAILKNRTRRGPQELTIASTNAPSRMHNSAVDALVRPSLLLPQGEAIIPSNVTFDEFQNMNPKNNRPRKNSRLTKHRDTQINFKRLSLGGLDNHPMRSSRLPRKNRNRSMHPASKLNRNTRFNRSGPRMTRSARTKSTNSSSGTKKYEPSFDAIAEF